MLLEVWGYHCVEPKPLADLNTFIERPLIEDRLLFWLAASRPSPCWKNRDGKEPNDLLTN